MNRPRICAPVLLILQPVAFYFTVLVHPIRHIPYDLAGFHTSIADFISWSLRQGRLPMWDPNPYCGYPIHADVQAQLFYPPAWVAFLARNVTKPETTLYWLEWLVALHMMAAGLFTFWFLRRRGATIAAAYLGGVVFQLGAFFASQAQHLGAVCGAAWMPLAWLAAFELRERFSLRWLAVLAMTLAMSFLAGFTAITLVVFFSTALVFLASLPKPRALLWFALSVAAVIPLSAVQLFPSIALTEWSFAGVRGASSQGGGMPPKAWLSFFWPNYHEVFHPFDAKLFHGDYEFTLLYCYCGMAAIAGCIAAFVWRRGRVWVVLAAIFGVLQCGNKLPGFETVFQLLPVTVRGAVYSDFFLAASCLAIAVACGIAFSRLGERWVWIIALATAVELTLVSSNRPMNTEDGPPTNVTSEANIDGDREMPLRINRLVNGAVPPMRLDVLDLNFTFSMGASLRRLPTPDGDNPFAPRRVLELRRLFAKGNWWDRQLPVDKPGSPLLDFLNVGLLIAGVDPENPAELASQGWNPIPGAERLRLYESRRAIPRFFLVDRVRPVGSAAEALVQVQSIDLRHEALVEGAPAPEIKPGRGELRVLQYEPDFVRLEIDSEGPGFLVASDSHHPDWRATVDGVEVPILLTDYAFRGVALPAGRHRVEMRYQPAGFNALALVSGLSWIIFGFLALRGKQLRTIKQFRDSLTTPLPNP